MKSLKKHSNPQHAFVTAAGKAVWIGAAGGMNNTLIVEGGLTATRVGVGNPDSTGSQLIVRGTLDAGSLYVYAGNSAIFENAWSSGGIVYVGGALTVPHLEIASGGSLSGHGKIVTGAGTLVLQGGSTLRVDGNTTDTLTVEGPLQIADGGEAVTFHFKIGHDTGTGVAVSSTLALVDPQNLDLSNVDFFFAVLNTLARNDTFTLITGASDITGFSTEEIDLGEGRWGAFSATGGVLSLTMTAIPEPGTYALLSGAVLLAGAVRRSRRKGKRLRRAFVLSNFS